MCHRCLVYLGLVYLHLQLISVPPLVYLGISVPWAGIPKCIQTYLKVCQSTPSISSIQMYTKRISQSTQRAQSLSSIQMYTKVSQASKCIRNASKSIPTYSKYAKVHKVSQVLKCTQSISSTQMYTKVSHKVPKCTQSISSIQMYTKVSQASECIRRASVNQPKVH